MTTTSDDEAQRIHQELNGTQYCPICHFELSGEVRGCTPFCTNCGWKGTCGDPTS